MLQGVGYIDDSGSNGKGVFVLAGYVMPVPKWTAFSDDWKAELDKEPSIAYFKATEAAHQEGQFLRISIEQRDRKVQELAAVIQKYEPICLATSVAWDDFRAVFGGRVSDKLAKPYYILFYRILELMLACQQEMTEIEPYEKVDFVFDDQGKIGRFAASFYHQIKTACLPEIQRMLGANPIQRDDKEVVALQAADMVAWHVHRRAVCPEEHLPILRLITTGGCERLDKEFLAEKLDKLA